jgi:hypothetical protein
MPHGRQRIVGDVFEQPPRNLAGGTYQARFLIFWITDEKKKVWWLSRLL